MKKYFPDWFISGLFLMILVAWLKPGIGMDLKPVHLGLIIDVGVVLIFFFYGLKLDPAKLKAGMRNWKMHVAIQLTTFLLFPLLIFPPCGKNETSATILLSGLLRRLPSIIPREPDGRDTSRYL